MTVECLESLTEKKRSKKMCGKMKTKRKIYA